MSDQIRLLLLVLSFSILERLVGQWQWITSMKHFTIEENKNFNSFDIIKIKLKRNPVFLKLSILLYQNWKCVFQDCTKRINFLQLVEINSRPPLKKKTKSTMSLCLPLLPGDFDDSVKRDAFVRVKLSFQFNFYFFLLEILSSVPFFFSPTR